MIGAKPLCIRFYKIDVIIRIYDGNRYLVLYGIEKYDAIYNRTRYILNKKSSVTYVFSHYYTISVDSFDSLPIEKSLTLHNVIIHIKSVVIKIKATITLIYC